MFGRLGRFVVSRARWVLALGVLVLVGTAILGPGAFGKLQTEGFDDPASESSRATRVLEDRFGGGADFVFVVSAVEGVAAAPVQKAGRELTDRLRADPDLTDVTSYFDAPVPPMRSEDGRHALVLASAVDGDADAIAADVVDRHAGIGEGISVRVGGAAAVGEEVGAQIGSDLGLAESIAIPLILVCLVLAFGNVVGALVTLGVGLFAILGTFAELSVLGGLTDVSIYSVNLTTGLGLGLAVDYGLLMVSRFREERATGLSTDDAVVRAVETAGRTIVFSATTVAVALASLLVFPLYFLRSFAYAGIGVMLITAATSVVLLPAALALLGARVDAWRVPGVRGIRGVEAPFWAGVARGVFRRPLLTALPVAAVLLAMAAPVLDIEFGTPDDRVLPATASSRQVGDLLRDEFPSDDTGAVTVVTTSAVSAGDLAGYTRTIAGLSGVTRVDVHHGTDSVLVSVVTGFDRRSDQARDLVAAVRDVPAPPGTDALVGGPTAELVDAMAAIGGRLPVAAAWMVLTTFVILFLFTGSVVQPVRALLLNALSLSATLGAMVWVFQDGHLASVLGFTPMPMDTSMMVLLFCVAFGLSMDYEVFVMGRVKEMRHLGYGNEEAVVRGLAHTGRIVSTAAALIAISFFAFLVSEVSFIQFFGLGTGLAILLDATVVRGVLVPAAMRWLGELAWWSPAPLRAAHRRVRLSEAAEEPMPVG